MFNQRGKDNDLVKGLRSVGGVKKVVIEKVKEERVIGQIHTEEEKVSFSFIYNSDRGVLLEVDDNEKVVEIFCNLLEDRFGTPEYSLVKKINIKRKSIFSRTKTQEIKRRGFVFARDPFSAIASMVVLVSVGGYSDY